MNANQRPAMTESKVDVLGVLKDRASYIGDEGYDWTAAELMRARAAVAKLTAAIERDAEERAIKSGLGVSEWPSFIPRHTAAALAACTPAKEEGR